LEFLSLEAGSAEGEANGGKDSNGNWIDVGLKGANIGNDVVTVAQMPKIVKDSVVLAKNAVEAPFRAANVAERVMPVAEKAAPALANVAQKSALLAKLANIGRFVASAPAAIITEGVVSAADLGKYAVTGKTMTGRGEWLGDVVNNAIRDEETEEMTPDGKRGDPDATLNRWAKGHEVSPAELWHYLLRSGRLNPEVFAKDKESMHDFQKRLKQYDALGVKDRYKREEFITGLVGILAKSKGGEEPIAAMFDAASRTRKR
jgi:hypothetical protein